MVLGWSSEAPKEGPLGVGPRDLPGPYVRGTRAPGRGAPYTDEAPRVLIIRIRAKYVRTCTLIIRTRTKRPGSAWEALHACACGVHARRIGPRRFVRGRIMMYTERLCTGDQARRVAHVTPATCVANTLTRRVPPNIISSSMSERLLARAISLPVKPANAPPVTATSSPS